MKFTDYERDCIVTIKDWASDWQAATHDLTRYIPTSVWWANDAYVRAKSERDQAAHGGRDIYKLMVLSWVNRIGIEGCSVRSEATFHLPGIDHTAPWPQPHAPLRMTLGHTSFHSSTGLVDGVNMKHVKWLNKITVTCTRVVSAKARTDPKFTWSLAEEFQVYVQKVQAALIGL